MTIAVIDDDAYVRSGLACLLRALGLATTTYMSADEFLASGKNVFGCIFSDVQMPGSSGLDLVDMLVAQGDATPVVLMTALPEWRVRELARNMGATDLLEKPIDSRALVDCLVRVLGPISG